MTATSAQPVYRYSIRQHRDDHGAIEGDKGYHVGVYQLAHEACNALLEISDMWQGEGGTVTGGSGFTLYVTAPNGEKITYRVWQV